MSWVNESHPVNREPGWGVAWSATDTTRQTLELMNGASLGDIFDPDFAPVDACQWLGSTMGVPAGYAWFHIRADLGVVKQITKMRVRYGSATRGGASWADRRTKNIFSFQGSLTGTTWVTLIPYITIPTIHVDNYKEYSDFYIPSAGSYRYYRFLWEVFSSNPYSWSESWKGFDLFSGWFDSEAEAEQIVYNKISTPDFPVEATSFTEGFGPENIFDDDTSTLFQNSDFNTEVVYTFDEPRLINWLKFVPSNIHEDEKGFGYLVSGSNDGDVWTPLTSAAVVGPGWGTANEMMAIDLIGLNSTAYSKYRIQFVGRGSGATAPKLALCEFGLTGKWAHAGLHLPGHEVSATGITSLAHIEFPIAEGFTGALTSGTTTEELWFNETNRTVYDCDGLSGLVAGDEIFVDETEFYIAIERELEVLGGSGLTGDIVRQPLGFFGNAGFGRQGNVDIQIERSVLGTTGEFGLMENISRSSYGAEGFSASPVHISRPAPSVSGAAYPGETAAATLILFQRQANGLVGARVGFDLPHSVSSSATQQAFANLNRSIPAWAVSADATVEAVLSGSCTIPRRTVRGDAPDVGQLASGSCVIPTRFSDGFIYVGSVLVGDITIPVFHVSADAAVDTVASAHFLRTNYNMTGRTRGNRSENFILKYEARS